MNNTMTHPFFASENLQKTINKISWLIGFYLILNLFYYVSGVFAEDIYETPYFKWAFFFIAPASVFCYYFLANRKWLAAIVLLGLLSAHLFFNSNIKLLADYYLSFVVTKNTKTVHTIVDVVLPLIFTIVAAFFYCRYEQIKPRKSKLLILLLVFCLQYCLIDLSIDLADKLGSESTVKQFFIKVLVALLYTAKDISFFVAFLHMVSRVKQGESLFRFSEKYSMPRKTFTRAFFAAYTVFFFIFVGFIFSVVLFGFASIGKFNIEKFIEVAVSAFVFLLSALFIGAIIKRRADELNNYYGAAGFISWIPIINIIGYLIIIFVEQAKWIKKKADDVFPRQQKIQLAICVAVILLLQYLLFRKADEKTLMITFMVFYSLTTIIVAQFKRSLRPVVIASALLHFFIAFFGIGGFSTLEFTWDYLKDYISFSALFLIFYISLIHYGIFYIVQQSLYEDTGADLPIELTEAPTQEI